MRHNLVRWLVTSGLAGATLLGVQSVGYTQPDVRDHRHGPRPPPPPPEDEGPPRDAPPPPKEERIAARAGFVWIPGKWDWKHGKWAWTDGQWDRGRAGKDGGDARWEGRGDHR